MLIQRFINTLPNRKDWRIWRLSTINSVEITIKKKNGRREKIFQNKCVSSQNKQYEKRRGRHGRLSAILSPTFSQRAASNFFVGPFGSKQRNPNHREILIKYQKRPTVVATAIFRHLIDSPNQMIQIQRCRWVWKAD